MENNSASLQVNSPDTCYGDKPNTNETLDGSALLNDNRGEEGDGNKPSAATTNEQSLNTNEKQSKCTAEAIFRKLSNSNDDIRKVKSHAQLSSTAHGVRILSKNISNTKVSIQVEHLMIVTKKQDSSLIYLTREMVEWLLVHFPTIYVYVDAKFKDSKRFNEKELIRDSRCSANRLKYWTPDFVKKNEDYFDLVVTLGGDGTVLFVSSIFQRVVPPVMSFALGSLGFLTIFKYENFREDLSKVLQSRIRTRMRMRLCCTVYRRTKKTVEERSEKHKKKYEKICSYHVLNELTIDRGPSPFISMLELYGDNSLLTVAQADGLIIATPTGSTAYSLSAGGSLIYPNVNAIAVTPICPHTLSFRPIILPDSMNLRVKVPVKSRAAAWAAFDGKNRVELQKGDYISIVASPYALPTLESSATAFVDSIRSTLNWNAREPQRSFAHMLSVKNQIRYESDTCDRNLLSSSPSDDECVYNQEKYSSGDEALEIDPAIPTKPGPYNTYKPTVNARLHSSVLDSQTNHTSQNMHITSSSDLLTPQDWSTNRPDKTESPSTPAIPLKSSP